MTLLRYEELEIVGFEGTVVVECEMVLPVAKLRQRDLYFKLPTRFVDSSNMHGIDDESIILYTREEIEGFMEEGGLTLLDQPLPAVPNAMVAYVNREFLTAAGSDLPDSVPYETISEGTWAICAPRIEITKLLDEWATRIMDNATLLLDEFFLTATEQLPSKIERFTDLALCAASDQTLRARIYERAGLAVMFSATPERLDNLYHLSVKQQFEWTWETFRERLDCFADILKLRAKYFQRDSVAEAREVVDPSASTEQSAPTDPNFEFDELMEVSALTYRIIDDDERYARCEWIAERYRERNVIPEEFYERAANHISVYPEVPLNNEIIKPLKADALIYYLAEKVLIGSHRDGKMPKMNSIEYLKEARDLKDSSKKDRGKKLGKFATRALKNRELRKTMVAVT